MTQTITTGEGKAYVFVAVEHAAILGEVSKYVGAPNEVAPLGALQAKLLQSGFLIGEIIDAMRYLLDEGFLRVRHRG